MPVNTMAWTKVAFLFLALSASSTKAYSQQSSQVNESATRGGSEAQDLEAIRADVAGALADASAEFSVPLPILQAIAFLESRWIQLAPIGSADTPPSYGVMGLREDRMGGPSLSDAAALIGEPRDQLKADLHANIRGGAALLNHLAKRVRPTPMLDDRLEAWIPVLREYSGLSDSLSSEIFAIDALKILRDGHDKLGVKIAPHPQLDLTTFSDHALSAVGLKPIAASTALVGYPNAIWMGPAGTGNYGTGRQTSTLSMIIIHTTESTASDALNTFKNPSSGVSAHYIVREDGIIWQVVDDQDTAYHCGNLSYNLQSIGIEMEGHADGPDFSWQTSQQNTALQSLVSWLLGQHSISRDRAHIFGHNQVPSPGGSACPASNYWGGCNNHHDPGAWWNWETLMTQIGHSSNYGQLSVQSSCSVLTLPQTNAPYITSLWPGQRVIKYDSSGSWALVFLSGEELGQPALPSAGEYHWDGWIPSSCTIVSSGAPQLTVSGSFPSRLKIRNGTTSTSSVLGNTIDGKRYAGTGSTQVGFDGATWYQYDIAWDTGINSGWSSGAFLTVANSCTYSLSPASQSFSAGAGSGSFSVNTQAGCSWSATTSSTWITITSGIGTGNGTVSLNVAANSSSSSRSGTITVSGQTFTVTQSGASCTYSLSPTSQSFGSGAGSGNFSVNTQAGCSWSATTSSTWITITSGTGTGNGTVSFNVAANSSSSSRSGTITVSGQTFTVTQSGASCTYSLSPTSQSFSSGAGSGNFSVNTQAGCSWSATTSSTWITITSGTGNGTVSFNVAANSSSSSRSGTITVSGQTFTVTQSGASCAYSLSPTSQSFGSGAGSGNFSINTQAGCSWSATTSSTWITITSGAGSGNGTVSFNVAANSSSSSRSGTITVSGQTFTVTQSGASCTYSLSPTSQSFGSGAGSGNFSVNTQAGCAWSATTSSTWITIASGTGNGNGLVAFNIAANVGGSLRSGTISLAGQIFSVTQGSSSAGFLFWDDMESGDGKWSAAVPWALTTESAHNSTHSWTDSPAGNYANNTNVSLFTSIIDMSNAQSAVLSFWHQYDFENGFDFGNVWVTTDLGNTYTQLRSFTGTSPNWTPVTIDLSRFAGSPSVVVAFQVISDGTVQADGWHIDDVSIYENSATSFFTLTPCRLIDTRQSSPLSSGISRAIDVVNHCGIPSTARAVSANVTVVSPTGSGYIVAYPFDQEVPATSTISFASGQVRANNAILSLSIDGKINAQPLVSNSGHVDFILDVSGYFAPFP